MTLQATSRKNCLKRLSPFDGRLPALLAAALLVACLATRVCAQRTDEPDSPAPGRSAEAARVPSAKPPRIDRVFVPARRPELWPEGKWLPVEAKRLLPLLNGSQAPEQRDRTWFRSAVYSATFDPASQTLLDGTAALAVAPRGMKATAASGSLGSFIPLDPLNLSIQSATWSDPDEPAILGTSADGEPLLFSSGQSDTLNLQWKKTGRQTPFGLEFDLAVPRAIVTKLQLKIPDGWTASTAESGIPMTAGNSSTAWSFPLGIRNRVRIRISPVTQDAPAPSPATIAWQQNTRFAVGLDSLQGLSEFTLADSAQPGMSLPPLLVSDEYQIDSIRDAAKRPIPWNPLEPRTGGLQRLQLVPAPSGIPIVDRFTVTFSPAKPARQLRHRLKTPRLARGILLDTSRVSVIIAAPLAVGSYLPSGMRLLETTPPGDDAGGGDFRLTFQHFQRNATLDLQLSRPGQTGARVEVRELALLQLDQTPPTLITDIQLTAGSREVFDFRTLVPREWEINSVQLVTPGRPAQPEPVPDDREITWQLQDETDSHRRLTIDFADSLPLKRPLTLRIQAELPDAGDGTQIRPISVPDQAAKVALAIAVIEPGPTRSTLNSSLFQPVSRETALQLADWSTLTSATDEDTRFWSTRLWTGPAEALSTQLLVPKQRVPATGDPPEDAALPPGGEFDSAQPDNDPAGNEGDAKTARPVATAQLKSRLSNGAGRDEHALTWQFLYPLEGGVFEFTLPEPATLLSAEWDGERTPVNEAGRVCSIPVPPNTSGQRLTVRYTLPSSEVFLRDTWRAAVPVADVAIAGFRWDATVSGEIEIVSFSDDFSLATAPPGQSGFRPGSDTAAPARPGWLVLFFGPLARSAGQSAFNPMSADSWVSWTSARPPTAEESSGWKTVTVECGSMPESFAIHVCHVGRVHTFAWFLLIISALVGAGLRAAQVAIRSRIGLIWITGCLASAILIPDTYAELVGAAVLGSVLSSLIPRGLIRPQPVEEQVTQTEQQNPMPSTLSMQRIPTAMILGLVGAGCGLAACFAQETPTEPEPVIPILIPFEEPDGPTRTTAPKLVYVQETGLAQLESFLPKSDRAPGSLITRADYTGIVDSSGRMKLTAELLVAVRGTPEEITLGIPARFLTGRPECLLDGQSVRILPDASGRRLIMTLPQPDSPEEAASEESEAAREAVTEAESAELATGAVPESDDDWTLHTLSFDLLPEHVISDESVAVTMPVPRVADSRLSLNFTATPQSLRIGESVVPLAVLSPSLTRNVEPDSNLRIEWSASSSKPALAQPDVECRSSAVVYAEWIDRRLTAKYSKGSQARYLAWRLPPDSIVLEESIVAPGLLDVQVRSSVEGKIVVLEIEPSSESFLIEIPWRQARNETSAAGFDVERPADPFDPENELTPTAYLAGFSPTLGFQFVTTAQEPSPETDPEGELSAAAWQSFWPEDEQPRPPDVIVLREGLSSLQLDVAPLTPSRQARPTQLLQIARDQVQMRFSAEVKVEQAAAFVHELRVPTQLAIDSVTVLEDDVDRLSHWVRRGPRLYLHLGSGTTGTQNIVLEGRLPVGADGKVAVSEVKVEHAESEEPVIQISRPVEWNVSVEQGLEPVAPEAEPAEVGSTNLPGTQFRFSAPGSSAPRSGQLVLTAAAPRDQVQSLTILRTDSATADGIHAEIHLLVRSLSTSQLAITFPDWPIDPTTIPQAACASLREQRFDPESQILTLSFADPVPSLVSITVTAELTRAAASADTDDDSRDILLTPPVVDAARLEQFLAVSPQLATGLEDAMRNPPAEDRKLPGEFVAEFGPQLDDLLKKAIAWENPLALSESSPSPTKPSRALVMHALMPGRKSSTIGLTRILASTDNQTLTLDWPKDLAPIAVHVNDQPQRVASPKNSRLTIPLAAASVPQVIELLWRRERNESSLKVRRTQAHLPAARFPSVKPAPVLIIPSHGTSVLPVDAEFDDDAAKVLMGSLEEWDARLPRDRGREILSTRILEALAPPGTFSASVEAGQEPPDEITPTEPRSREDRIQSLLSARLQLDETHESASSRNRTDSPPAGIEGVLENRSRSATLVAVSESGPISLWVVDDRLYGVLTSVLVALLAFPVIWILLSLETGDRMAANATFSWLVLGLIWWLCLRASPAGLLLAAVSVVCLAVQLFRSVRQPETAE